MYELYNHPHGPAFAWSNLPTKIRFLVEYYLGGSGAISEEGTVFMTSQQAGNTKPQKKDSLCQLSLRNFFLLKIGSKGCLFYKTV